MSMVDDEDHDPMEYLAVDEPRPEARAECRGGHVEDHHPDESGSGDQIAAVDVEEPRLRLI